MKFWGLLAMVAHIANTTQQNHKDNTTNHNVPVQRGSLSLILVDQGQPYNSKHKPQWLPNETLRFNWDGLMYSTCNITKLPVWLIFLNQAFSLVMMLASIFGPYVIFPNKILSTHAPYPYIHVTHITVCGRTLKYTLFNIVYNKEGTPT